jgi:hypothetical protein
VWDSEGDGDEVVEIEVGETAAENRGVEGSVPRYRNPYTVSIRTRYGDRVHGEIV